MKKKDALGIIMKNYTNIKMKYSKLAIENIFIIKEPINSWSGRLFKHSRE